MKKDGKRKKRLSAALIMIVLGVAIAWFGWSLRPDEMVEFDRTSPGAAREGLTYKQTAVVDRLAAATAKLLLTGQGYRSWQMTADQLKGLPAESATDCQILDQVMAARYHLEQRDRKSLLADLALIQAFYLNSAGLPVDRITRNPDGSTSQSETLSVAGTLAWLRILADSYSLTGDEDLLKLLRATSDSFLDRVSADGTLPADTLVELAAEAPRQDPAATPTVRPSISPTPVVSERRSVIRLADIDLFAIQQMIRLDTRWQTVYDRQRTILTGSFPSAQVRLPAYAFDPVSQGYIGFSGSQPLVDMEDALLVLLHLHEAGEPTDAFLTYVRSRFFSEGAVFRQVHRATGDRVADQECIVGYALLARMARMSDDTLLYEKATTRLAWHIATNPRSEALGAVFQTNPDGRVMVTARDNLAALTAFR